MKDRLRHLLAVSLLAGSLPSASLILRAEESLETRKDLAAKVIPLLEQRCASCHGSEAEKIRGDFGTVSNIPKLRESGLVDLESPEDSELYLQVRDQLMPELTREERAAGKAEPDYYSSEETALLLSWIRAGAPDRDGNIGKEAPVVEPVELTTTTPAPEKVTEAVPNATPETAAVDSLPTLDLPATTRPVVTESDALAAAVKDVLSRDESARKRIRYISVVNLQNQGGISDGRLSLHRQGVSKLLNSLSTNPKVATFDAVGPSEVLYRVDLDKIGWSAALWDEVASFYPYAIQGAGHEALAGVTGAKVSVLRADWLAANATRGQLYNRILGIPANLKELEAKLKVDIAANLRAGKAPRSGFTSSGVSRSNRLVERHEIGAYAGALWISYDFAKSADRGNIHDFPLGPEYAKLGSGGRAFKEDGGELIWTLPNGFYAYLIVDTLGNRLDGPAPTDIVADREAVTGRSEVVNAISCMICHQTGVRDIPADEIRPLAGAAVFNAEEKKLLEALHVPTEELNKLIELDRAEFQSRLSAAGVGSTGMEPIRTLVEAYEAPVKLTQAAAELGLTPEALATATRDSGATLELYLRLATAGFPRDAFEKNKFPELVQRLNQGEVINAETLRVAGNKPSAEAKEGDSAAPIVPLLKAAKGVFLDGETMEITVTSPVDAHVRVIYRNAEGKNLLLFPNTLQEDDSVKAGKALVLSGADAPMDVVVEAPFGKETIVAIASDKSFADQESLLREIKGAKDQSRVLVEFEETSLDINVVKSVRLRAKDSRVGSARLEVETKAK